MSTELMVPQDLSGKEYRAVTCTYGNGVFTPVGGSAQAINLEPGATVVLLLPQSGSGGGMVFGGGGGHGNQPVLISAPQQQSPSIVVINTEPKKAEAKPVKATREAFKNI